MHFLTQKIEPVIAKYGFAVQVVGGDRASLPFAYTIGLSAKRLPELLMIGSLPLQLFNELLNSIAGTFISLGAAAPGRLDGILTGLPVLVREIESDAFGKYGLLARSWAEKHGHPLRALQVVIPDAQGRFPGDVGYDWVPIPLL